MRALTGCFAFPLLALAVGANASPQEWATDFAPRGLASSPSDAVVLDDGSGPALHVCGRLLAAGEVNDVVVAAWNGGSWRRVASSASPFPSELSIASHVALVESFDAGAGAQLYAAGYFSAIDGVTARSIARHTSMGWESLDSSVNFNPLEVTALRTVNYGGATALYVGQRIFAPTGTPFSALTRWDGSQWSSIGTDLEGRVFDIAAFDDGSGEKLYVAGQLLQPVTSSAFASVLVWDGSNWSAVGGAIDGVTSRLMVFDDGSGPALYAAGTSSPPLQGVARYRNGAWEQIGATVGGDVNDLAIASTSNGPRLVAVGAFASLGAATSAGLAMWNGSQWQNIGATGLISGFPGPGANAAATGDLGQGPRLFVGGAFQRVDTTSAHYVVSWSDAGFDSLGDGAGLDRPVSALTKFGGGLYVGGSFIDAPGANRSYLARWSGVEWSGNAPAVDGGIDTLGVVDFGGGELMYTAGEFTQPQTLHFAWNGSQVSALAAVTGGAEFIHTQLVHDDGAGPVLYVGGNFHSVNGLSARNIARWDGQNWSSVGPFAPNGSVYALAFHDDGQGGGEQLYAAGAFTQAGGQPVYGIARYDGAAWHPVGNGFNSGVFALAVHDDGSGAKLYAGGAFSSAPPTPAGRIARWDGVSWQPVGDGLIGQVYALEVFDDGSGPLLLAGGDLRFGATFTQRGLARWNGVGWAPFAGGVDGRVNEIAVLDDGTGLGQSLWVGGVFRSAGDVVSMNIARWGRTCASESYCSGGTSSSGCTPTLGADGRASASQATNLVLNATQLEGARSGHLFYGVNGAIASPWGQSSHFLCVKAPTQRTATQTTGGTFGACDGVMTLDWNAFSNANPSALGQPFSAGQDIWAQAFFRDPPGPKTTALSSALRFTICP